jgi:hypothetical protein
MVTAPPILLHLEPHQAPLLFAHHSLFVLTMLDVLEQPMRNVVQFVLKMMQITTRNVSIKEHATMLVKLPKAHSISNATME